MLEQMYQDFLVKVAPQLDKGFQLTKDYVMDFFGRYVTYLRVISGFGTFICLLFSIAFIWAIKHSLRKEYNKKYETTDYVYEDHVRELVCIIGGLLAVLSIVFFFGFLVDFIKAVYIPDIVIFEKILSLGK